MKFVVFEGLDGAGKSTLIAGLKKELTTLGQSVLVTREPGGSELGEEIRKLLLRVGHDEPVPRAELLLYEAARAQHVDKTIKPALARNEWVICDRYSASSIAFQSGGRGLKRDKIEWLNNFATEKLQPALWVLLDLSTEEARRRMDGRELDRFEREAQEFHERVRQKYLEIVAGDKERWLVLDASRKPEELMLKLLAHMREMQSWPK
jgi:dTMP kinase